jgi:hypothetical protein
MVILRRHGMTISLTRTTNKGKKEFKIKFSRMECGYNNFRYIFKIIWDNKEDEFDFSDIYRYNDDAYAINFNKFNIFSKEFNHGKDIKFLIDNDTKNKLEEMKNIEYENLKNRVLPDNEFEIIYYQEVSTYDSSIPLNRWDLGSDEVGLVIKNELKKNNIRPVEFLKKIENKIEERERISHEIIVKDKVLRLTGREEFYKIINEIKEEKENKRKQKEEELKNEIDILDEDNIPGSRKNLHYEHSLGIRYSQKDNKIKVVGRTYDIKEELKKAGFRWDGNGKYWYIDYSEGNLQKAVDIVRKYDKKRDYAAEGYVQCWECGRWWKPKNYYPGMDTYCGC